MAVWDEYFSDWDFIVSFRRVLTISQKGGAKLCP